MQTTRRQVIITKKPPPTITKPTDNISPKAWYQAAKGLPNVVHDAAQVAAVEKLDVLWHQLVDFKSKRNQFLGRSLLGPDVPKLCICKAVSVAATHF